MFQTKKRLVRGSLSQPASAFSVSCSFDVMNGAVLRGENGRRLALIKEGNQLAQVAPTHTLLQHPS